MMGKGHGLTIYLVTLRCNFVQLVHRDVCSFIAVAGVWLSEAVHV